MSDTIEVQEVLEKKCPRCGAATSGKAERCAKHKKELRDNKKKPGHWQRAQTKADDALRRQKGKNGTAHKKNSGLGSRKSIVKQTQSAEKKTGEKLSPDRKNNAKGYASSNTRMVPEKLNRGRHHVDEKKLRNWRKRLKKHNITAEEFYTLMKAKAVENNSEFLSDLLKNLSPEGLEQYMAIFDQEDGLEKSAAKKLEPEAPAAPSIHNEIGKTHTVEIHPHLDQLFRAKGLIKDNDRKHLHIQDYKKHGFPHEILPRDAHGKVTPEMIDKHIEGLPKHKVDVKVIPYTWGSQQHRKGNQIALSVNMNDEHRLKMNDSNAKLWAHIKDNQHQFDHGGDPGIEHDQIGWSRIDPYSKDNHWHVDEIQSDFQNKNKINKRIPDTWRSHGEDPKDHEENADKLLEHISHGHDDPQHMIHSATNALARKLGVKSMSMDTPEDQANQSNLSTTDTGHDDHDNEHMDDWINDRIDEHKGELHSQRWGDDRTKDIITDSNKNPNFKSGVDRIGGLDKLKELAGNMSDIDHREEINKNTHGDELGKKISKLPAPEKDAINDFLNTYQNWIHDDAYDHMSDKYYDNNDTGVGARDDGNEPDEKFDISKLPVHQIDTYHKRPKKLGMKEVDKAKILGEHPEDKAEKVQYMKLHKNLQFILDQLKKTKNN